MTQCENNECFKSARKRSGFQSSIFNRQSSINPMNDTPKQERPAAAPRAVLPFIVPRKIRVIGVPLDLGQSRRGVDMGPSAVRVAGLEARLEALGHVVEDAGNITVALAETKKAGDPSAKYLKEITATCTKQAEQVLKTLEAG